ncbi:caspase-1-like [Penaeus chinensis]|uniref:Caspase n=1 Tax=Penaeus chinensis TaxID=139456 RepID=D7PKA3_PENCE|nr:caspase-1-like [Penaeus chinensis]ADG84879.1 caspase [Penaeus chinensis]
MSSGDDAARAEAQPNDGRDGGNQGLADTTENTSAEAEEPAKAEEVAKNGFRGRPTAYTEVDGLSERYPMNHRPRGSALIFAHSKFDNKSLNPRPCAAHDAEIARAAFKALDFKPEVFFDLTRNELLRELQAVSKRDHSGSDAFAIVFMSHGEVKTRNNMEFVWAKDDKIPTKELWINFTAERCAGLAGKPKLYFIQACRGPDVDKGVNMSRAVRGMAVQTDSIEEYVIPIHADQLVMWASYPGFPAFTSKRKGIQGSVFIHYLAENLKDYANTSPRPSLSSILLKVSREVAVLYETDIGSDNQYHENKQVPYIHSTLLREIYF